MKNFLFSIIAIFGACTFFACSNGDYNVNTSAAANESINPFNLLDSADFSWSGADVISANVNGVYVNIDSAHTTFALDTSGANIIFGSLGVSHGFLFRLRNVYAGNTYLMGYPIYERYAIWSDSITAPKSYASYWGNVGQVQIIRNDPFRLIAKFHFQAMDKLGGTVINVSNGWINVGKP